MSEQLVRLLALCVLALLYVFFFRVMRAVWASVATPHNRGGWRPLRSQRTDTAERSHAAPRPTALVVCSPLHVQGERHALGDSLTIGRDPECDIVIDDSYSSSSHARLFRDAQQHLVEDLGSTNGTYLNRQKVSTPAVVRIGDFVQIGSTVFEVSA